MKLVIIGLLTAFTLNTFAGNSTAATTPNKGSAAVAPDNSGINKRDDSVMELTAEDQSNQPEALEVTRKIRAELNKNKDLSTYAKNIKIITTGKKILLKCPVRSTEEVAVIKKAAMAMAPSYQVQNDLDVVKK